MKYIALLRGINISGKNKISMVDLKNEFEQMKYENVSTYLNSGNVIFTSDTNNKNVIKENIHLMISNKFNLDIPVHIITEDELKDLLNNAPEWWGTVDNKIYDNIIFIIFPAKYEEIYNTIGSQKDGIEKIQEYKNSIFWSFDLNNYRKSNWWSKTASTSVSNKITIRTANTMRKILEICERL